MTGANSMSLEDGGETNQTTGGKRSRKTIGDTNPDGRRGNKKVKYSPIQTFSLMESTEYSTGLVKCDE